MITMAKRSDFSIEKSDLIQDLTRLLHFQKGQIENFSTRPEVSKANALSALGALLKYLALVNDACNLGHFQIELINFNR